jgi:hypothetical protein
VALLTSAYEDAQAGVGASYWAERQLALVLQEQDGSNHICRCTAAAHWCTCCCKNGASQVQRNVQRCNRRCCYNPMSQEPAKLNLRALRKPPTSSRRRSVAVQVASEHTRYRNVAMQRQMTNMAAMRFSNNSNSGDDAAAAAAAAAAAVEDEIDYGSSVRRQHKTAPSDATLDAIQESTTTTTTGSVTAKTVAVYNDDATTASATATATAEAKVADRLTQLRSDDDEINVEEEEEKPVLLLPLSLLPGSATTTTNDDDDDGAPTIRYNFNPMSIDDNTSTVAADDFAPLWLEMKGDDDASHV